MSLFEIWDSEEDGMIEAIYTRFKLFSDYSTTTSFVVVEGRDDLEIYKRFIDYDALSDIVFVNGRENVEAAFPVPEEYRQRSLGIIDLDFDYAFPDKNYPEGIIVLETHDLETFILSSPAFVSLLEAYGVPQLIATFEKQQGCTVIQRIIQSGKLIGILRLIDCIRKNNGMPGINFKVLPFEQFIHHQSLILDIDALIECVIKNTNHPKIKSLNPEIIKNQIMELDSRYLDEWVVCQGHDLLEILTVGLKFVFGYPREYSRKKVQNKLKAVEICQPCHIIGRHFHKNLLQWEKEHIPYKVLLESLR